MNINTEAGMNSDNKVNKKVLILVGNDSSRRIISEALESEGFHIIETGVEKTALARLNSEPFDLVYIDIDSQNSGLSAMHQTHCSWPETLIVLHDDRPTMEKAIAAIKVGAADYLIGTSTTVDIVEAVVQAFRKREEHVIRINQYLGQAVESFFGYSGAENGTIREPLVGIEERLIVGELELDQPARTLSLAGSNDNAIQLTKGETEILAALMSRPGKVLSSQEILRIAWGYEILNVDASSIVRPSISRIRSKLIGTSIDPNTIRTIHGVGYTISPVQSPFN
jgi:DNA-binding response OmpR family regulator